MNFTQIAVPHEDIIKGNLTMDVYAANLSQVVNKTAPKDYLDADLFFRRTYFTKGLNNILKIAEERLRGNSGDSVIQLQTPFGGGKTHTLISLYHSVTRWNANVAVFDGVALSPNDPKPWEEIERQLTGKIELTRGNSAPGSNNLIKILRENGPALILMDEILEYTTKASAVKVEDSNLASQTIAFIQELTAAVSTVGNAILVLTLPSSTLEHYDENAERMYQQLQKITGRVEKIYTPVEDEEIEHVIRKRLFSKIDEGKAKEIVDNFLEHIKNEGLLAQDELLKYRERFLRSYPFKPEVIETLYKKWGTFPTFQRTRGVLRLLSLVVNSLITSNIPFIRLGDFDLSNESIRRELIKHIGPEWDSIIAQDITGNNSGAKKIDSNLSPAYRPYKLGSVVSTTIFLNSFSGIGKRKNNIKDIKISTLYPEFHSSEIDNIINQIRDGLFYVADDGLYFTNQPNLNKIIIDREESISREEILQEERKIVKEHISGNYNLKVYFYPQFSRDIPDSKDFKLIINDSEKPDDNFFNKYGEQPRVYKNTLFFLCKYSTESNALFSYLKKLISLKSIENDTTINLTDVQRKEVKTKLEDLKNREYEEIRNDYRSLFVPVQNGFKKIDMGIPTFGERSLDKEVFETLKTNGALLEKISPRVIKEKYLKNNEFLEIKKLYEAFLKTPGELRILSEDSLLHGINEGIRNKIFSLGILKNDEIEIVNEELDTIEYNSVITTKTYQQLTTEGNSEVDKYYDGNSLDESNDGYVGDINIDVIPKEDNYWEKKYRNLSLKLDVPVGEISTVVGIVGNLVETFKNISVKIEIDAMDGELSENNYENIIEALSQANIRILKEKKDV